jgi:lauroyl/myristoyl acyltransferase
MLYWGHRLGSFLSRIFPLWLSYGICEVLSPLIFLAWKEKRRHAIENMRRVLGPNSDFRHARRLAVRSFVNYGKYLVDMMRLGQSPLDQDYRVEGWEHVRNAMDKGKGLIFIGGHIGNSDLGAALLAQRGYPVNVIAEPLSPPRWDTLVQQARAAAGLRVVPLGQAMMRSFRVLRERQILAILIDRPMDEGVTVEFFGRKTTVPAGAAGLALRSGAAVVGAYIVRQGNHYVAEIFPEIDRPASSGDQDADLQEYTQRLFSWLEQVIRTHPDQWFMFRRMWPAES